MSNDFNYRSPSVTHDILSQQVDREAQDLVKEMGKFYYNDGGSASDLWDAFKGYAFHGIPNLTENNTFNTAVESYRTATKEFFNFLVEDEYAKHQFFTSTHSDQRKAIFLDFLVRHSSQSELINEYHNILLTIFDQLLEVFRTMGTLLLQQSRGMESYTDLSGEVVKHLNDPALKQKKTEYTGPDDQPDPDIEYHNMRASEQQKFVDTAKSKLDKGRDRKSGEVEQTMSARQDQIQILASLVNKFESLLQSIMR